MTVLSTTDSILADYHTTTNNFILVFSSFLIFLIYYLCRASWARLWASPLQLWPVMLVMMGINGLVFIIGEVNGNRDCYYLYLCTYLYLQILFVRWLTLIDTWGRFQTTHNRKWYTYYTQSTGVTLKLLVKPINYSQLLRKTISTNWIVYTNC